MQAIILAGGRGSRLSEETDQVPKPMVTINGVPILLHIMQIFAFFGIREFIIVAGYKGEIISEYFAAKSSILKKLNWDVQVIDTGLDTGTAGRIRQVSHLLHEEFWITYGDGLIAADLREITAFHHRSGCIATITAVHPPARFGYLEIQDGLVQKFREKALDDVGWINGGFIFAKRSFFEFLHADDLHLETSTLPRIADSGALSAYQYQGFWQPMDTLRDKRTLEDYSLAIDPPWIHLPDFLERFR